MLEMKFELDLSQLQRRHRIGLARLIVNSSLADAHEQLAAAIGEAILQADHTGADMAHVAATWPAPNQTAREATAAVVDALRWFARAARLLDGELLPLRRPLREIWRKLAREWLRREDAKTAFFEAVAGY